MSRFSIRLYEDTPQLKISPKIDDSFTVGFKAVQAVVEYVGGEKYEGEYDITPKIESQVLRTARKVLDQDVNVRAIPYAEVQNSANGKTVTIG
jgi:hypothetical protein